MQLTLTDIAKITNGACYGNTSVCVHKIATDSRTLMVSDGLMFCAIEGKQLNGHDYIHDLCIAGVQNFLVNKNYHRTDNANYIVVNDTVLALQQIAAFQRQLFHGQVIGITGSNGKTILKEWLASCLAQNQAVLRSPKSYNSQIGVPLSVLPIEASFKFAVIEAGISEPGEMDRLESVIKPQVGIFTTIGDAHQENFTSYEEKVREKLKLFKDAEVIIASDKYNALNKVLKEKPYSEKRIWLISDKNPDAAVHVKTVAENQILEYVVPDKQWQFTVKHKFSDQASVENLNLLVAALVYLNFDPDRIHEMVGELEPVAMRLEIIKGINSNTLINDTYNSDINSLQIALDLLGRQEQHRKHTLILSDIKQSGLPDDELYKQVSDLLSKQPLYAFFGVGPCLKKYRNLFQSNAKFFLDTKDLLKELSSHQLSDHAILVKGARSFLFENIIQSLQYKEHQTVLEINQPDLINNLNVYKRKLKPDTKVLVMVKALSYGSGTHEIANWLQYHRVDYLGVAFANEGVELRTANIYLPIMVMNVSKNDFQQIIDYKLEPEIYSFNILTQFIQFLQKNQRKKYPVHLKLDTGMHRLGFMSEEIEALKNTLQTNQDYLKIKSIFSHLAAADDKTYDGFTHQQYQQFNQMSSELKLVLNEQPMLHLLNSAGIERFPDYQFDMVRLGIGLYGVSPGSLPAIKQVSTLRTHVTQIKYLKKGDTVGYGRRGEITSDQTIATLPIGYADGLNRRLGNGAYYFLIHGKKAKTIGSICMDMCMIDVTDIEVKEGDEVIVFGAEHPLQKMAKVLKTIPYEILTSVSSRVKKIYIHE